MWILLQYKIHTDIGTPINYLEWCIAMIYIKIIVFLTNISIFMFLDVHSSYLGHLG